MNFNFYLSQVQSYLTILQESTFFSSIKCMLLVMTFLFTLKLLEKLEINDSIHQPLFCRLVSVCPVLQIYSQIFLHAEEKLPWVDIDWGSPKEHEKPLIWKINIDCKYYFDQTKMLKFSLFGVKQFHNSHFCGLKFSLTHILSHPLP